ncbi:MAG: glycosyltransferase [Acidimicrobiales bacterium]
MELFPKDMAEADKFVDEIWTLSDHAASAIRAVVNKPVHTLPPPIIPPPLPAVTTRADLNLPLGYLFLFCFDFHSGFDRKNPLAIIDAFRQTFPLPGKALLVIKSINGARYPDKLHSLVQAASARPDILLHDGSLTADQQAALMMTCDCYISLHRAEGFGLTMAEAMALGKPVIATAYSGNLEYMTVENSFLVPFTLQPVGPGCDPYPEEAQWAAPNIKIAAEMMRFAFEHPDAARLRGRRAAHDVAEHHSPEARARLLLSLLASSRPDRDPDQPGGLRSVADGVLARGALKSVSVVMNVKRYLRRLLGPLRPNSTVAHVQGGA